MRLLKPAGNPQADSGKRLKNNSGSPPGDFIMNKIEFLFFDSPLGEMVAGATGKGICFLEWEDRGGIERILKRVGKRYRLEEIRVEDNKFISQLQKELDAYFDGSLKEFKTPLDIKGTAFEKQVWQQLLNIPSGDTKSYGQIAEAVEKPKAVRAVGRANGMNYISIVIPCHRVIGADGSLTGYGGKLWRKKKLLELESNCLSLF